MTRYEKSRAGESHVISAIDRYVDKHNRFPTFKDLAKVSSLGKPTLRYYLSMLTNSKIVHKQMEKRKGRSVYVYSNHDMDSYWI